MTDNKDPGYRLPAVIDPDDYTCIRVYVPTDTLYLAAFWRSYEYFASWIAWERDTAHRGKDAAEVWRVGFERSREEYIAAGGECDVIDVRQNSEAPCILEKNLDGTEWIPFADLQKCPPQIRLNPVVGGPPSWWNPTTGEWEIIPTPAETPDYDPAFDDPQTPFPEGYVAEGNDPRCVAAANVVESIKQVAARVDYGLFVGGVVTYIWTEVIMFMFGTKVFPKKWQALLRAISTFAAAASYEEFHPDFDGFDWQEMRDAIACYFELDGTMTAGAHAEMLASMGAFSSPVWSLAIAIFTFVGPVGMNNAATYAGITEADDCPDCDDSEWTHIWDENTLGSSLDWTAFHGGTYAAGQGWNATNVTVGGINFRQAWITTATFDPFRLRYFKVTYNLAKSGTAPVGHSALQLRDDTTVLSRILFSDAASGTGLEFLWEGDEFVSIPQVLLRSSEGGFAGSARITRIEMRGPGTVDPFA